MTNTSAIILKSKELEIPFENLLAGYILEELVTTIYESNWGKVCHLKESQKLGLESYRRVIPRNLELVYMENIKIRPQDGFVAGQKISEELLDEAVCHLKKQLEKKNIQIKKNRIETTPWILHLQIEYEGMYIPMDIKVQIQRETEGFSKKQDMRLIMENNKRIQYSQYSIENVVAEYMVHILKNMELLNEMEEYLYLYEIICTQSLEGRKVKERLIKRSEEEHILLTSKRYESIQSYRDYSFMKKKWKVLLRKEKRTSPTWEEVLDKIALFMEPIYTSIIEDTIFFGDWMPEIERFLD